MAKRLSIGTIGTKEPGRKTAKVSFSAGNDVVDRLQEIARQEDATVSRVVDRLLRAGLAIEESEAFQDHLAERLEKAVLRLESMPWGGTWKLPYNVEAEQHLLSMAMCGRPDAAAPLSALDPVAFFVPAHRRAWRLMRSEDVIPGEGAALAIARLIEPQEPTVCDIPTEHYLTTLSDAGQYLIGAAGPVAFGVLDAYFRRLAGEEQHPRGSEFVEANLANRVQHYFEGLRTIVESGGFEADRYSGFENNPVS